MAGRCFALRPLASCALLCPVRPLPSPLCASLACVSFASLWLSLLLYAVCCFPVALPPLLFVSSVCLSVLPALRTHCRAHATRSTAHSDRFPHHTKHHPRHATHAGHTTHNTQHTTHNTTHTQHIREVEAAISRERAPKGSSGTGNQSQTREAEHTQA